MFEFRINHAKELIKELADKFESRFTSLGENTEKYETFRVLIRSEVKIIGKNRRIDKIIYLRLHFSDGTQWQVYYQILLIILLKELIELNVNTDMKKM